MRTPEMKGLPALPEADVLRAIRKLEFQGTRDSNDLGPSVEMGVSGRSVSSGGPLLSSSPRDLGLLLDDALIDDLLLAEGPKVSIPVEMALGALADAETEAGLGAGIETRAGHRRAGASSSRARIRLERTVPDLQESTPASAIDTLGARWRMTSWSGHETDLAGVASDATGAPSLPAFLGEAPLAARKRVKEPASFPWGLLSPRASSGSLEAADPRWPTAETGAAPGPRHEVLSNGALGEAQRHDSTGAIAHARRSPSAFTVAFASAIFPGWGQALNEERGKAAIFRFSYLATLCVTAALAWRGPLGRLAELASGNPAPAFHWLDTAFTVGAGLWLLAVYDAFVVRSAHRR